MIQLSLALTDNVYTRPVIDGRVRPDAIDFDTTVLHPSEIFWRQLKFAEFDVSEMSVSSLLIAVAGGDRRWVALPVYTMRRFFHTWTWVRGDRIGSPADLKGKRVGVPEYQQTAAVWARGVLQHEFGVAPGDIDWWMERTPDISHGGATGFKPPPGVRISQIPCSTNIGEMLAKGELDATLLYLNQQNLVDRSTVDLARLPEMRPLFEDEWAEARRYYAKTSLFPINHAMVIRRELAEAHPWLAINIVKAFDKAKALANREAGMAMEGFVRTGLIPPEARAAMQGDPMPYGVKRSRKVLETIAGYAFEQGLTDRRVGLDEVFAPSTLEM